MVNIFKDLSKDVYVLSCHLIRSGYKINKYIKMCRNAFFFHSKLELSVISAYLINQFSANVYIYACAVNQKRKKECLISVLSNFNTKNKMEIKLLPINGDYWLLSFIVFKFSLGGRLHGGSLPIFIFFQCKPPNLTAKLKCSPLRLPGTKFSQLF